MDAKSKRDVVHWCHDHVKVEKWTMVCRTCLGTAIDTNGAKRGIVSFKTEHKMKENGRDLRSSLRSCESGGELSSLRSC